MSNYQHESNAEGCSPTSLPVSIICFWPMVRDLHPGMGTAVAERTVYRSKLTDEAISLLDPGIHRLNSNDPYFRQWVNALHNTTGFTPVRDDTAPLRGQAPPTRWETWEEVSDRVALGNVKLSPEDIIPAGEQNEEYKNLKHHIAKGNILLSGRHLQHGDETQRLRNQEVFTDCLVGSTLILTIEHGPVEIANVAGETVKIIAGDGEPRSALINSFGEEDVFEIVFRQKTSGPAPGIMPIVRATASHNWKLIDGTITDVLKVGDVIAASTGVSEYDPEAVIHGLVYGDGSAHKTRRDHVRPGVSQGRTYATIRVCKKGIIRDEIHDRLDQAGYTYSTPAHARGDRCYYIGKFAHAKELPFTHDPQYIAGFIYGWWLADGHKGVNHALEISTSNMEAADWLCGYAAYAGYVVTMRRVIERKKNDGSYANGKPLNVIRIRRNLHMKVASITPVGRAQVYCAEEPVTSSFLLANGLLTGTCSTSASAASYSSFT